ncbi:MAG: hypothetical protein UU48_C0002G0104 [Candidatus Uhrbacteria bacterium GW2011_GWF2_41_16]|uniref:Uncharacterized protein n=2 Tax=Candidatus Uhriibacteriota TaxID=1752732 RepID=A0A0G0VCC3_9BACT|nr:MAG: hypothetical protein UU31_C0003G0113 [Candidatus Uhrbacteria bacterium GW2011_GWA2_41_10]KKR87589.1 MAG: hypothetical protein UU35_C0002G0090 [Candidatus Uhrbacteria bacterium GW2011_GWC2_41_11]KKR98569.1 MAG: hypothetical protein UU48_C0002G0104 [Candidatus Uhrbacteria bacterium GW2011_GWF2_41_16]
MSTLALRHHFFTFAFLPVRRERHWEQTKRFLRIQLSPRQYRRSLRQIMARIFSR